MSEKDPTPNVVDLGSIRKQKNEIPPVNYLEFRAAIAKGHEAGITYGEIAKAFGMNPYTAAGWHVGMGIPASGAQAAIVKWLREEMAKRK